MKECERTNEAAGAYAKQCIELAKDMGVYSIDLWSKMQEIKGWQKTCLRFVPLKKTETILIKLLFKQFSLFSK